MANLSGVKVGDRLLVEARRWDGTRQVFANAAKVTKATVTTECGRRFCAADGVDREKPATIFEARFIARPVSAEEEATIRAEWQVKEEQVSRRRAVMDAVATAENSAVDFWDHMHAALLSWKDKQNG
jgi:hypothetical protein